MMTDLEMRRRRAAYRAAHRGTKEMDWLLGRYADTHLATLEGDALSRFEQLIALPDPEIQQWLMTGSLPPASELHGLVEEIRAFHGLDAGSGEIKP